MSAEPLGEFLLRGAILLSLAGLVAMRFADPSDRQRLGRGAGVLMVVMAVAGLLPAWQWIDVDLRSETIGGTSDTVGTAKVVDDVAPMTVAPSPAVPPSNRLTTSAEPPLLTVLFGLWVAGVCVGLLRLAMARLRLARLLREARRVEVDGQSLWQSAGIASPLSFGLLRSGIIVPMGFEQWSTNERRLVLMHEQRHLARRDAVWLGLAELMAVLHWPNPLAWWARRRFESDCELAVDAEVLERGASPAAYSSLLVRLASGQQVSPALAGAMAMARKSSVPLRVERILAGRCRGRVAVGPLLWLALGFLGGVAVTIGVTSLGEREPEQISVRTVFVEPTMPASEGELLTRTYTVPPTFGMSQPYEDAGDPFAADAVLLTPRPPMQEYLEEVGIAFPGDSTAIYNPATSQVILRNTIENHQLMEALVESIRAEMERAMVQVFLTTKVVEAPRDAEGLELLDSGVHSELAGVLTEAQSQHLLRTLSQGRGVDLLSAPSLMVRSGQKGRVEVSGQEDFPDFLLETKAVIGADGFTIDLTLFQWTNVAGVPLSLTIWDGQTVIWTEPIGDDRVRLTFVTARLLNPAGEPVNEVGAGGESEPGADPGE